MTKYTLTKVQYQGFPYYAILNNDSMEYFAGYDFMGSATWEKHLDDCSWLLEDEAYQIKADLESADADDSVESVIEISGEEAEAIIAFVRNHEREEIPDDVWELCIRLYDEVC